MFAQLQSSSCPCHTPPLLTSHTDKAVQQQTSHTNSLCWGRLGPFHTATCMHNSTPSEASQPTKCASKQSTVHDHTSTPTLCTPAHAYACNTLRVRLEPSTHNPPSNSSLRLLLLQHCGGAGCHQGCLKQPLQQGPTVASLLLITFFKSGGTPRHQRRRGHASLLVLVRSSRGAALHSTQHTQTVSPFACGTRQSAHTPSGLALQSEAEGLGAVAGTNCVSWVALKQPVTTAR